MTDTVSLRPVGSDDDAFLFHLFAATRAPAFACLTGGPDQLEVLLRLQFNAQRLHYRQHFPEAIEQVIESSGQQVGRLYVNHQEGEIRILDIALLPDHRSAGIGGALLKQLLAEAASTGKPARLQVERHNPARRLYWRLGFRQTADTGVYVEMEWTVDSVDKATARIAR